MADVWNPFDSNNPVYVEIARRTKTKRRNVQRAMLTTAALLIIGAYANKGMFENMFGGPVNQFGVIRRK